MTTTAIYAHAVGVERRSIVARLWETDFSHRRAKCIHSYRP